jgi:hypothetical protein
MLLYNVTEWRLTPKLVNVGTVIIINFYLKLIIIEKNLIFVKLKFVFKNL